tara:strand:+ start:158 stop:535 length:378 start_codon:yes stop_codon:yes gene_type:complete
MPRTLQRQTTTSASTVLDEAKSKFLQLKPSIDELKQKLKVLNKEQKTYINAIYEHMDEQELDEYSVGMYTFKKKEVEKCSFTEKNFAQLVDGDDVGEELLEKYKEKFTESKTSYKVGKQRNNDNN